MRYLGFAFVFVAFVACGNADEPSKDETTAEGNARSERPARSPESRAKASEMLNAARMIVEPVESPTEVGTTWISQAYPWLRRLVEAERYLADDDDEDLSALTDHLERTRRIFRSIESLYDDGLRGGEAETYFAWKFYVAEAESWLIAAGYEVPADPDAGARKKQARAGQAMLDAAKKAYEATVAAFKAGHRSPSDVHQWSRRWMHSELELKRSRDTTIDALRAHLERMKQLYKRIEALHDADAEGGDAENLRAGMYFVAEAEFEISISDMPDSGGE